MAFSLSFDAGSAAGLGDLDAFIRGRTYVIGFVPTQTDVALFNAIGKAPDAGKYPNVARFYAHIASFSADARGKFPAGFGAAAAAAPAATKAAGGAGAKKAAPAAAPAASAPEDSDAADLFGDDGDAAAKKVAAAKPAAKPEGDKKGKKEKAPLIEKSSVVYEVKPVAAGQDMEAIKDAVRAVALDGLVWGEQMKVVDVAFGIQKLVVQAVIEDEKVALEDIEERVLGLMGGPVDPEDNPEGKLVSSIDLLSMNKVT